MKKKELEELVQNQQKQISELISLVQALRLELQKKQVTNTPVTPWVREIPLTNPMPNLPGITPTTPSPYWDWTKVYCGTSMDGTPSAWKSPMKLKEIGGIGEGKLY